MASNSYRSYVQRSFLHYTVAIILFLCILVLAFLTINTKWLTEAETMRSSTELAEILEQEVEQYKEGLAALANDAHIIDLCKQQTMARMTEANRLLYGFVNDREIHGLFALVDVEGNILCSNLYRDNRLIFLQSSLFKSLMSEMLEEPDRIFLVPSRLNYFYDQTGDLMLGRGITDGSNVVGLLFFDLLDEEIYGVVSKYHLDDVILTDQFNNLVFSVGRQSDASMGKYPVGSQFKKDQANMIEIDGKPYLIIKKTLGNGELNLYTVVSVSFQRSLFRYASLFLALVGLLMFITLKPLTTHIANRNLNAIEELRKSVLEMGKGNMTYALRPQVFKEFQELHDTFKKMVLQREELQKRNSELLERKRVMEIKHLEEKINPHFVFNVLETLRYEVLIDPSAASGMIMAFANIMRYNLYYRDTIVPFRTDIAYVKDYLMLQKMRYNRRLNYSIEIPEDLLDCRIPKLVIQPIVENALKHGMKNVESIHIRITASMENNALVIRVQDDGKGIEPEILDKLVEDLEREDVCKEHIGMYNSHRVIRLLYGSPYGLKIESTYEKGTRVTILLPANRGAEYAESADR